METTTVTTKATTTTTITTTTTTKMTDATTDIVTATTTEPPVISGDINADSKTNLADLVLLQKWLLRVPKTKLANWQAGDFDKNQSLNGIDLIFLRRKLMEMR